MTRDWMRLGTDDAPARILREVAAKHRCHIRDLCGPMRDRPLVLARQESMWRLRKETGLKFEAIGAMLNRDPTTAIHGVKMHTQRIQEAS